ncbi:MAG: hypothetical protein ACRD2Q_01100 [Terriglobales bacterium]
MQRVVYCVGCIEGKVEGFVVEGGQDEAREAPRDVPCPYCGEQNLILWPADAAFTTRKRHRRRKRKWVSQDLRAIVVVALLYLVFSYSIGSSAALSAVLAIMGGLLIWLVYPRKGAEFVPFRVSVTIKWPEVLRACGLIKSEEELREIDSAVASRLAEQDYHILHDGFTFTVLGPRLIYWDDRKTFQTKIDLGTRIEEIKFKNEVLPGIPFSPAVVFRDRIGYYVLGIVTPGTDERERYKGDHRELLPIAVLPREEFEYFYDSDLGYDERRHLRAAQYRDELLAEHGWTRPEDYPDRWEPDPPSHLEHRYVRVWHEPI